MPPFFPVEKLNNAHAAVETNSRVLSPVVTGSTPRYRSSPQFHAPAKQPSSPAEFSSPIGPIPHLLPSLGLVVSSIPAPNNLGRKPLPFNLCALFANTVLYRFAGVAFWVCEKKVELYSSPRGPASPRFPFAPPVAPDTFFPSSPVKP
jgi:hypothetical protein